MLKLDFSFSDQWNRRLDATLIREMSEIDLRYRVALGDLILVVNGKDCSALWGWIPMIDFAVALCDIRDLLRIRDSSLEIFEFTENDATISFQALSEYVKISTSYAPVSECVLFAEFDYQVSDFRNRVFSQVLRLAPSLEENNAFRDLSERTAKAQ